MASGRDVPNMTRRSHYVSARRNRRRWRFRGNVGDPPASTATRRHDAGITAEQSSRRAGRQTRPRPDHLGLLRPRPHRRGTGQPAAGARPRRNVQDPRWTTVEPVTAPPADAAGSDDEDPLAVPVEVLAGRRLGASGEQQRLPQRWPPVELPGQWVSHGGVGQ
jgi:hypothetical protein